ncbi:hypothetical protein [Maribacter sp. 2-571]|uniref:hypothetical protein n=1 Tax=Maribacter sp. 2-571 TaxID=3417569 RepID=UPI003D33FE95
MNHSSAKGAKPLCDRSSAEFFPNYWTSGFSNWYYFFFAYWNIINIHFQKSDNPIFQA